jgi:hypothetical protein
MAGVEARKFDAPHETRTPHVTHEDGSEWDAGRGDAYVMEPGMMPG